MDIRNAVTGALAIASANSAELTLGIAIAGVPISMILSGTARLKADDILAELEEERYKQGIDEPIPTQTKLVKTWHCYILPVVSGVVTIGCLIWSHKIQGKKLLALASAYALSDAALRDLKAHIPEKKLREYQHAIDQEKVGHMSMLDTDILATGQGDILCIDAWSGLKFFSNAQNIRDAVAATNAEMIGDMYANMNYTYDQLNLPPTIAGDSNGWNVLAEKSISVWFDSVVDKEEIPALVMHIDPPPRPLYDNI